MKKKYRINNKKTTFIAFSQKLLLSLRRGLISANSVDMETCPNIMCLSNRN